MKNKLTAILLLFCLVIPLTSTVLFFQYQKKQIKRKVKHQIIAGIDKEELVLLKFTEQSAQSELKWKHSKEFEYKGSMYDIVETSIHGDTTYYWCWWDNKETELNKQLGKVLNKILGKDDQKKDKESKLTKFYSSLFYCSPFDWKPLLSLSSKKSSSLVIAYYSIYFPPPSPPPQIA